VLSGEMLSFVTIESLLSIVILLRKIMAARHCKLFSLRSSA
jgi:hypothetical protein